MAISRHFHAMCLTLYTLYHLMVVFLNFLFLRANLPIVTLLQNTKFMMIKNMKIYAFSNLFNDTKFYITAKASVNHKSFVIKFFLWQFFFFGKECDTTYLLRTTDLVSEWIKCTSFIKVCSVIWFWMALITMSLASL